MPSDSGEDSNHPHCLLWPLPNSSDNSPRFFDIGAAFGDYHALRGDFNTIPLLNKVTVVVLTSKCIFAVDFISRINHVFVVPLSLKEIHSHLNGSDSILAKLASLHIAPSYMTIDFNQQAIGIISTLENSQVLPPARRIVTDSPK